MCICDKWCIIFTPPPRFSKFLDPPLGPRDEIKVIKLHVRNLSFDNKKNRIQITVMSYITNDRMFNRPIQLADWQSCFMARLSIYQHSWSTVINTYPTVYAPLPTAHAYTPLREPTPNSLSEPFPFPVPQLGTPFWLLTNCFIFKR